MPKTVENCLSQAPPRHAEAADICDLLCYNRPMTGHDIIATLRQNEAALRARGVSHAALFGSRARGDNRPDSDTDIMIEIDPDAPVGSVFETVTFGDSGVENIYADIASTTAGGDVITDTLVTPLGDLPVSFTLDASAGLAGLF